MFISKKIKKRSLKTFSRESLLKNKLLAVIGGAEDDEAGTTTQPSKPSVTVPPLN